MLNKKLILSLLISISILNLSPSVAHASEVETSPITIESRNATTHYKYWKQTNSSFKYSRSVGSWIVAYNEGKINDDGQRLSIVQDYKQAGSISVGAGISIPLTAKGWSLGPSVSYTPGSYIPVNYTIQSQSLTRGYWKGEYRRREEIHQINLAEYEKIYALGVDRPTGVTKVGDQAFPSVFEARWTKVRGL